MCTYQRTYNVSHNTVLIHVYVCVCQGDPHLTDASVVTFHCMSHAQTIHRKCRSKNIYVSVHFCAGYPLLMSVHLSFAIAPLIPSLSFSSLAAFVHCLCLCSSSSSFACTDTRTKTEKGKRETGKSEKRERESAKRCCKHALDQGSSGA